jgi:hypothetical protein
VNAPFPVVQPIIFSFENAPKKSGNQQVIRENQDFDQ